MHMLYTQLGRTVPPAWNHPIANSEKPLVRYRRAITGSNDTQDALLLGVHVEPPHSRGFRAFLHKTQKSGLIGGAR